MAIKTIVDTKNIKEIISINLSLIVVTSSPSSIGFLSLF